MSLITAKPHELQSRHGFPYESFSELPVYDQRYFPRWHTVNKAFYRKEHENVLVRTQTRDLTLTGVNLYIKEGVHVNDRLDMRINLSPKDSFRAEGIVLWTKVIFRYSCAGILFDGLAKEIQGLILKYGFGSTLILGNVNDRLEKQYEGGGHG